MEVASDESLRPDVDHPRKFCQSNVTNEEKEEWTKWEALEDEAGVSTIGGKPVLPKKKNT